MRRWISSDCESGTLYIKCEIIQRYLIFPFSVSPCHEVANLTHGIGENTWLAGSGYIGRTAVFLAAGYVSTQHCPENVPEDYAMRRLVERAGFRYAITRAVIATSVSPPANDCRKSLNQLFRWKQVTKIGRRYYRPEKKRGSLREHLISWYQSWGALKGYRMIFLCSLLDEMRLGLWSIRHKKDDPIVWEPISPQPKR